MTDSGNGGVMRKSMGRLFNNLLFRVDMALCCWNGCTPREPIGFDGLWLERGAPTDCENDDLR